MRLSLPDHVAMRCCRRSIAAVAAEHAGATIVDPTSPWKTRAGSYSAFGDASGLLAAIDDRLVTTRNGDEIELRFVAPPDRPPDSSRTWLLCSDRFEKDVAPNSAANDEVGPNLFHGLPIDPYPADVVPPHAPPSAVRRIVNGAPSPAGIAQPGSFDRALRGEGFPR